MHYELSHHYLCRLVSGFHHQQLVLGQVADVGGFAGCHSVGHRPANGVVHSDAATFHAAHIQLATIYLHGQRLIGGCGLDTARATLHSQGEVIEQEVAKNNFHSN